MAQIYVWAKRDFSLIFILMERKMRQNKTTHGERIVKNIKRKTRKQYSAEEKIRIVLDGLRGTESVPELRRIEGKGGKRAAICYSLIETCKLNDVNPQSWLTQALSNIQDTKISDLDKLLPRIYFEGR